MPFVEKTKAEKIRTVTVSDKAEGDKRQDRDGAARMLTCWWTKCFL